MTLHDVLTRVADEYKDDSMKQEVAKLAHDWTDRFEVHDLPSFLVRMISDDYDSQASELAQMTDALTTLMRIESDINELRTRLSSVIRYMEQAKGKN